MLISNAKEKSITNFQLAFLTTTQNKKMVPLVWLVTGATSGIGRATINEIISRGDKVIASGRNVEQRLGELKSDTVALLELDTTSSEEVLKRKVQESWNIFGHIDVLFNNAGMSSMKSVEEAEYVIPFRRQPPCSTLSHLTCKLANSTCSLEPAKPSQPVSSKPTSLPLSR